nr:TRAP transporter large permease subunit [Mameliella alba]
MAQVSIVLSMLMGGISGSAVADASMEARLLGPSMREQGYSPAFIAAVPFFLAVVVFFVLLLAFPWLSLALPKAIMG